MSRIGKLPIKLKEGTSAEVNGNVITVKSSKSTLSLNIPENINVKVDAGIITVERTNEEKHTKQLHGTTRANIANMVKGVEEGYKKELIMNGTGYKAEVKGKEVVLYVGFSHPISLPIPEGVKVEVGGNNNTTVTITGADKQVVGQLAALVRGTRKPEPYLGKGVRYSDEHIRRKEGKKAGK